MQNVTMIEDLMDIQPPYTKSTRNNSIKGSPYDDSILSKENADKIGNKFIRQSNNTMSQQSGMNPNSESFQHPVPHPASSLESYTEVPINSDFGFTPDNKSSVNNVNCVDVANHTSQCPVCSRLYRTDYSWFIAIIIILSILNLLLLKKVLNV